MPDHDDEKLAVKVGKIEVKVDHLTASVENLGEKVDMLYGAFNQAKGARWPFIIFAALATFMGTVGGAIAKWIPAFSALAR